MITIVYLNQTRKRVLGLRGKNQTAKFDYAIGRAKPNYPMPAIPYAFFESDTVTISIWPGVIQYRISDEYLTGEYTGFGAVVTIEWYRDAHCYEVRYDDFD